MKKNVEIKIADRDGTFIYALGPSGTNSFQAHIQSSGPDALTLEERQELARLIAAAPETAAERDHLRAVNAELLEALEEATDKIQMYHETRTGFADDARQVRKLRGLISRASG